MAVPPPREYLAVISRLKVLASPLYKSHDTKQYKFQRQQRQELKGKIAAHLTFL